MQVYATTHAQLSSGATACALYTCLVYLSDMLQNTTRVFHWVGDSNLINS